MEKQISIIIPTYNMENYIGRCLDSLLIPEIDLVEVLVVNDGSKDKSSEIAHEYSCKYPNSIKVIDKKNGNYGSCINAALPLASGRYVKILDADDLFDSDAFSSLVNELVHINDDAVITTHVIKDSDNRLLRRTTLSADTPSNISIGIEDAKDNVLANYIQMHQLAYNASIFNKFKYHQTEGVSYTDSQWAIIPLAYCKTCRCMNLACYVYMMGREGQTMSDENMSQFINNFFIVIRDTLDYYIKFKGNILSKSIFRKHFVQNIEFVYFQVLKNTAGPNMQLLSDFDSVLKAKALDLYKDINQIKLDSRIGFKVFEDIRKKHYPANYQVPFCERLKLSAKVKCERIRNFFAIRN